MAPNIVFLHIPKTAGQSVHSLLVDIFGREAIAPARVNHQLRLLSIPEMRRHRVYSGHLDWALLDCLEGPRFAFTILRDPVDRILSFYFFLRKEAAAHTEAELNLPQNQGKHAALTLSVDAYFCGGKPMIRNFLDNHYDNFYAYYLAGRTYDARQNLLGCRQANPAFTEAKLLDLARANMATLDAVYPVHRLDLLERDMCRIGGRMPSGASLQERRVNQGEPDGADQRLEKLRTLGATQASFDRIEQMTRLDRLLWRELCEKYPLPA
jgi:hypothetical protein